MSGNGNAGFTADTLPCLGVGASLSLQTRPDPAALVRTRRGPSFIEYAGNVSFPFVRDDVERIREAGAPVLFHPSYINFCGTFPNEPGWLAETAAHLAAVGSPWFAQDCAYCFWGPTPGYSTQLGFFLPPIFNEASLARAIERVREVQAAIPLPVAVEPPPVTFVVGRMRALPFFGALATAADSAVLLDAGHLVSWEMATGLSLEPDLAGFPVERVVELHIAGGRIEHDGAAAVYVDAHECPIVDATWRMLELLLPRLPCLRAVCFECEGASEATVLAALARIRHAVVASSASTALVLRAKAELRGA